MSLIRGAIDYDGIRLVFDIGADVEIEARFDRKKRFAVMI